MGDIRSFEDLRTWKEGHALAVEVYRLTKTWPADERYGLISQIRRAAASIPTNIAEGMGRGSAKDLMRFLTVARGSTQEVIYQLLLARDLGYIVTDEYDKTRSRFQGLNAGINAHITQLSRHAS